MSGFRDVELSRDMMAVLYVRAYRGVSIRSLGWRRLKRWSTHSLYIGQLDEQLRPLPD